MVRFFFSLSLCLVLADSLYAQYGTMCNCDSIYQDNAEPMLIGDVYFYGKIGKGSHFFIDDWLTGEVTLSTQMVVKNKKLRYNGFIDRVIWLVPNVSQQVKLDKESVEGFTLYENKSGIVHKFSKIHIKEKLNPDSTEVYAKILYAGKISLFAYYKVELTGSEKESGKSHFVDIYAKKTKFYFMFEGGRTLGFERFRKRDIFNLFPDKKEQILQNFRKNGQRKFKTESDLIGVTKVLNEVL